MEKKHRVINWSALLVALLSGSGGLINESWNADDKDNMKTVFAKEIAGYHEWKKNAVRDMDDMRDEVDALHQDRHAMALVIVGMQKDIQYMNGNRPNRPASTGSTEAAVSAMVKREVEKPAAKELRSKQEPKNISQQKVNAYKEELFAN